MEAHPKRLGGRSFQGSRLTAIILDKSLERRLIARRRRLDNEP
jgi:hypothetical protein